jgi:ABC-type multidrug transport system fused ATPase/permease subunit
VTVRLAVRKALGLLAPRDRRLLRLALMLQVSTSMLDLLGVLLIGLVGALAITTVQSQPIPPAIERVAAVFGLEDASSQYLIVILASAAAIVLLTKSLISSYLTRRVFSFLANRQALVSARLAAALLAKPLTFVQNRSSQETAFALVSGAGQATMVLLGQLVVFSSELALLLILSVAMLLISPWAALGAIVFFSLTAIVLQRAMGHWSARIGETQSRADIRSLAAVQEALATYRELTVSARRPHYVDQIQELRWQAARVAADAQFVGMLPKYLFEAALVVGGFALAAVLFATQDAVVAAGTLALFLAAASRVMPSLLRLQGATLGLRAASGAALPTFELADSLGNPTEFPMREASTLRIRERLRQGHADFEPRIEIEGVWFTYPGSGTPALRDVSLGIKAGTSAGLVGKSGAGKSTLADVILGVLSPDSGRAVLGGKTATESAERWPGAIAYVPQEVVLVNASLMENVALGLPLDAIDEELVTEALARAHLADLIAELPKGTNTVLGDGATRLSGGQKQRLGLARGLYSKPRLLVLDEATSALDAETEFAISETIRDLNGDVTTVVVAHRLSTVRSLDLLAYMSAGTVTATGSFDELITTVPSFRRQATLMGLG